MSDKQIITQVILNQGERLVKEKHNVKQPNYFRIGNGTMNKHNIKAINLIAELCTMSDSGRYLVNMIQERMVYNPYDNMVEFAVRVEADTDAEKKRLTRGFKELYEKDLVRRVKRGHYMLNPNAIITDYDRQIVVWDKLVKHSCRE